MRSLIVILSAAAIATPAAAQQSGLLLGVASDSGYRTLWIAPVDGNFVVAANHRGLIVPRADGFHHLGVVRWCSMDSGGQMPGGPFYDAADMLLDLPVGRPPTHPDSAHVECATADSIVRQVHDSLDQASRTALAAATTREDSSALEVYDPESYQCYSRELHVTHAGPRYLSVFYEEGAGENCEAGRESWSAQRSTTKDDQEADLTALLTKAQARRITTIWEKEKGECALENAPADNWGIVRALGRWEFAFTTSGATACAGRSGNEEAGFSIKEAVPATVARRDASAKWLPMAKRLFGAVDDIFTSPANDVVIIRSGSRLLAFIPHGSALGDVRLELALPASATVVMTEWATGRHVDEWTRQLKALHEQW